MNRMKCVALERGSGTFNENLVWLRGIGVNVIVRIGDQC